jgi:hypothetical protein
MRYALIGVAFLGLFCMPAYAQNTPLGGVNILTLQLFQPTFRSFDRVV